MPMNSRENIEKVRMPRVCVAASGSGSGKTLISCALLYLLKERGLDPAAFKCGPDYIDPMFHKEILGRDSRNLDTFFSDEKEIRRLIGSHGGKSAVIEGVMGIYDGADLRSCKGSSYETALISSTPVLLAVDASGKGRTLIAEIKGILREDEARIIKGILLNRISPGFFSSLKGVLEEELEAAGFRTAVLGCMPEDDELKLSSRHLGLIRPEETDGIYGRIAKAAAILEQNADVGQICRIMEAAPDLEISAVKAAAIKTEKALVLAVARDSAFCFYYKENLELFEKKGIRIEYFSPLEDREIPEDASGLLLGGGYPELYLKELSGNASMLRSVKRALEKGIPSLAECGGFMYLHNSICDQEGKSFQMVGAVPGECRYTGHLVRFGYMQLESTSLEDELSRSFVGMKGHEFHYYDSTFNGCAFTAAKPSGKRRWEAVVRQKQGLWGFPHFYYGSDPEAIDCFIESMRAYHDAQFEPVFRE